MGDNILSTVMKTSVSPIPVSLALTLVFQYKFFPVLAHNARMPEELEKLPNLSYQNAISTHPVMIVRYWKFVGMKGSTIQPK